MSYKRVVRKKGKNYGPYIYESYRDNDGNVKKRYLGKKDEQKIFSKKSVFLIIGFLVLFNIVIYTTTFSEDFSSFVGDSFGNTESFLSGAVISFGDFFSDSGTMTGKAHLNVREFLFGEESSEMLSIGLKKGELIPAGSKIVVEQLGETREYLLSDLVSMNSNGTYFVEGKSVSGSGEGFGFAGKKEIYPEIHFTLLISPAEDSGDSGGDDSEEIIDDELNETEVEEPETNESVEETQEEIVEQPEEIVEEIPEEVAENEVEEEPAEEPETIITGEIIGVDEFEVEGVVSRDNDFEYNLVEQTARLKTGSIYLENVNVDYLFLDIEVSDDKVVVSSDYSDFEEGFGEDYLLDEGDSLDIELASVGVVSVEGDVVLKLVYNDIVLAEIVKEIDEFGEVVGINETEFDLENMTGLNITEMNETEIIENVTLSNVSVETLQYKAVINRPVKWMKKVKVNSSNKNVSVEIPKDAEDIVVKTGVEVEEAEQELEDYEDAVENSDREEIVSGLITGQVSLDVKKKKGIFTRMWDWISEKFDITGNVILENEISSDISETADEKIVDLSDVAEGVLLTENETEIAVEYYTEAPLANETNLINELGKRIVVHAPSEFGYTDILAYTLIYDVAGMEQISMNDLSKLKLYWYENEETEEVVGEEVSEAIIEEVLNESVEGAVDEVSEEVEETNETEIVDADLITGGMITGKVVQGYSISEEERNLLNEEVENLLDVENVSVPEGNKVEANYTAYDLDEDGFVDYVEWIVPHLSVQTYEIVLSTTGVTLGDVVKDGNYYHLGISSSAPYDSLVGYWNFDADLENTATTTIYDFSNYGNDGTSYNQAVVNNTACLYGGCVHFDGAGDYVSVSGDYIGNSTTVSLWFKIPSDAATGYAIRFGSRFYIYYSATDNKMWWRVWNSTGSIKTTTKTTTSVNDNNWHHFVGIFDNELGKNIVYLNGVNEANTTDTIGEGLSSSTSGNMIGTTNTFNSNFLNGSIDEVMVFNTSLTPEQISAIYNNQSERFVSFGSLDTNQTAITSGDNQINVSSVFENLLNTNISLGLDYYNGSWFSTAEQNLSSSGNVYEISPASTNLTMNFTLLSDSYGFYTPLLNDSTFVLNTSYEVVGDETAPQIEFIGNTPEGGSTQGEDSIIVNVSSSDDSEHYTFVDFDKSLIGWWRMDDVEGSNVLDLSSYKNNGTAYGNAAQTDSGYFGKGFEFDGEGDYLSLMFDTSDYSEVTISTWVKFAGATGDARNYIYDDTSGSAGSMLTRIDSSNVWYFGVYDNNANFPSVSSTSVCSSDWTHLVGVYNGTDSKIYVNGVLERTSNPFAISSVAATSTAGVIGAEYDGTDEWNGTIDEVLVFNRSLSADEILALYNASANQYYNNFTSLAEGTHTFTGYAVDAVGNVNETEERSVSIDATAPTITIDTPTNGTELSEDFVFNASVSDDSGGDTFGFIDTGLVSWWRMDDVESLDGETLGYPVLVDYIGENNGDIIDAVQTDEGKFGDAFEFDGANSYINIPSSYSFNNTNNGNMSISIWFKRNDLAGAETIASFYYLNANNRPRVDYLATNVIRWYPIIDGTTNDFCDKILATTTDWHHLVLTINDDLNNLTTIYIDGASLGTCNAKHSFADIPDGYRISLGVDDEGANKYQYLNGSIDEVMIFNRSLSADEVLGLYNATVNRLQTTVDVDLLSEGVNNITAYASDEFGNVGLASVEVDLDTTAPVLNIYSPENTTYDSSEVLINVSTDNPGNEMIVPNLDNSLVSWWRMDDVEGSGNPTDYFGIYNGTITGTATQTSSGKFGDGFYFDGSQSYIEAGSPNVDGEITMSVWMNLPNPSSGWYGVLDKKRWQSATYKTDYAFIMRDGNFDIELGNGTTIVRKYAALGLVADTWTHVVITYNKTRLTVYKNGASHYTNDFSLGDGGIVSSPQSQTLHIGNRRTATWYPFNGSLDEVMIFNRSLSADEVLGLYNATAISHTETLAEGTHTFSAYAQDYSANLNASEEIVFSVSTAPIVGEPSLNRFSITNSSGNEVAFIDDKGELYLKGTISASQESLIAPANSFVIQNSSSTTIAYFSSGGDLYLKGAVSRNSDLSGRTSSNFEIYNSTDNLVAFFDNVGNLKLQGGYGENYL